MDVREATRLSNYIFYVSCDLNTCLESLLSRIEKLEGQKFYDTNEVRKDFSLCKTNLHHSFERLRELICEYMDWDWEELAHILAEKIGENMKITQEEIDKPKKAIFEKGDGFYLISQENKYSVNRTRE